MSLLDSLYQEYVTSPKKEYPNAKQEDKEFYSLLNYLNKSLNGGPGAEVNVDGGSPGDLNESSGESNAPAPYGSDQVIGSYPTSGNKTLAAITDALLGLYAPTGLLNKGQSLISGKTAGGWLFGSGKQNVTMADLLDSRALESEENVDFTLDSLDDLSDAELSALADAMANSGGYSSSTGMSTGFGGFSGAESFGASPDGGFMGAPI